MQLDITNIFPDNFSGILNKSLIVFKRKFLQLFFISLAIHLITYLIFVVIFNKQNVFFNFVFIDVLRYLAGQTLNVVCFLIVPIFLLNIKINVLSFLFRKDIFTGVLSIIAIQFIIKTFSIIAPSFFSIIIFFCSYFIIFAAMYYILNSVNSGESKYTVKEALQHSFFLVKNSYLKILIFSFGIYLIITICSFLFTLIGIWQILDQEAIQAIDWEAGIENIAIFEQLASNNLFFLIQTLANSIFQILSSIFISILFYSLAVKENLVSIEFFFKNLEINTLQN